MKLADLLARSDSEALGVEVFEADLVADAGWDEAMEGCEAVLHTASPFFMADDDTELSALLKEYFESEGFDVRLAHDGLEAMDALRDGLRNLGQALAENRTDEQQEGQGAQAGNAQGRPEPTRRDPLGRQMGNAGQLGTDQELLGREEINRRAEELLGEIRRRSAEQDRPEIERDYLRRLLNQF